VVPFAGHQATLAGLREALAGKVVVDAVVPMEFRDGSPRAIWVEEGSAAEQAQALLPQSSVVGAFHHLSARKLRSAAALDADCLVAGDDDAAKAIVFDLVREIAALRPLDAGGLSGAYQVELFTAALLNINRRYKTQASVRIVGVE
ncbi:MAG TPA: NADPH-dependent F420 reductase, partial [Dehalococcoidia bacterium]|nr:NADPH-dependent F420 reductase [Dehalococcoidia bacterium]